MSADRHVQGLLCIIAGAFERLSRGSATLAVHRDEVLSLRRRLKEEQRDKALVLEGNTRVQCERDAVAKLAEDAIEAADTAKKMFTNAKEKIADLQKELQEGKERYTKDIADKSGENTRLQAMLLEHKAKVSYLHVPLQVLAHELTEWFRKQNRRPGLQS